MHAIVLCIHKDCIASNMKMPKPLNYLIMKCLLMAAEGGGASTVSL